MLDHLLKTIEANKEKYAITETSSEAEKLRARMMERNKSKEQCLQLQQDIQAFMMSDPTEKERRIVEEFAEGFHMTCSAIEDGLI